MTRDYKVQKNQISLNENQYWIPKKYTYVLTTKLKNKTQVILNY